jgi:hypothetical protein
LDRTRSRAFALQLLVVVKVDPTHRSVLHLLTSTLRQL